MAGPYLIRKDITSQEFMLSPQAWERFRVRLHALGEFGRVLQEDFIQAENAAYAARLNLTESRAMVRGFGSLIDGLSLVMQELSISTAEVFGRGYNRFLKAKREERTTTTYQRIYQSYRLVAEFVPKCPLANLPEGRWDELHEAIEIRNRILHPSSAKDLELTPVETSLVARAGDNSCRISRSSCNGFSTRSRSYSGNTRWCGGVSCRRFRATRIVPAGADSNTRNAVKPHSVRLKS